MQNLVVLLVAVVGLTVAQSSLSLDLDFISRFNSIKSKQACLGMDAANARFKIVDAAVKTCFTKFREPQLEFTSSAIRYPSNVVSDIAKDIQVEADYFRCVMTEIGVTNSYNELDLASMTANVNRMDIAAPLKKDLLHAVTECRKYALCVPDNKDAYPVPADVVTTNQFLNCEKKLRNMACIKNDAKYIVDQFNLKGADGRMSFLQSDSEKVTALLFANAVVGPDDFGLYE